MRFRKVGDRSYKIGRNLRVTRTCLSDKPVWAVVMSVETDSYKDVLIVGRVVGERPSDIKGQIYDLLGSIREACGDLYA